MNFEASNEIKECPIALEKPETRYDCRILDFGYKTSIRNLNSIKVLNDLFIFQEIDKDLPSKRDTIIKFSEYSFSGIITKFNFTIDSLIQTGKYSKEDLQNCYIQIQEKNDFFLSGKWIEADKYVLSGEGSMIAYHVFNQSIYAVTFIYPSNSDFNIYELTCIYELNESWECLKGLKKRLYHTMNPLNDTLIRLEIYDHAKHIIDYDLGFSYQSKELTQLSDLSFESIGELFATTNLEANFVPLDSIAFPSPLDYENKYWLNYFGEVNDFWGYFSSRKK